MKIFNDRLWALTLALTTTALLLLAGAPGSAEAATPYSICRAAPPGLLTQMMSIESNWRRHLDFEPEPGRRIKVWTEFVDGKSAAYGDVWYESGNKRMKLLRVPDASPTMGLEANVGIAQAERSLHLLAVATESGMRFVGAALWVIGDSGKPRRVAVAKDYRQVVKRAGMAISEGGSAPELWPVFTNPSVECSEGDALLVERGWIAGQKVIACWKFDSKGDLTPLLRYTNSEDHKSHPGARKTEITRFFNTPRGARTRTTRITGPSANDGTEIDFCEDVPKATRIAQTGWWRLAPTSG